jgi:rubrerythrin
MATNRRVRPRTCARKRRYDSAREAEATAAHRRAETGQLDLEVYPCTVCGGWHIGHAQPARPRL